MYDHDSDYDSEHEGSWARTLVMGATFGLAAYALYKLISDPDAVHEGGRKVRRAAQKLGRKAEAAGERVADKAQEVGEKVADKAEDVRQDVAHDWAESTT